MGVFSNCFSIVITGKDTLCSIFLFSLNLLKKLIKSRRIDRMLSLLGLNGESNLNISEPI